MKVGILCLVKIAEKALMQRQSGTENGGENYLVSRQFHCNVIERRIDCGFIICQCLAYLVCHYLSDTLYVVTEEKGILLIILVAELAEEKV